MTVLRVDGKGWTCRESIDQFVAAPLGRVDLAPQNLHTGDASFSPMTSEQEAKAFNRLHKKRKRFYFPEEDTWKPPPFYPPDSQKVLVITRRRTKQFVGQSTWWRRFGHWTCIGATRTVSWILDVDPSGIRKAIRQRGLACKWVHQPINFAPCSLTAGH